MFERADPLHLPPTVNIANNWAAFTKGHPFCETGLLALGKKLKLAPFQMTSKDVKTPAEVSYVNDPDVGFGAPPAKPMWYVTEVGL